MAYNIVQPWLLLNSCKVAWYFHKLIMYLIFFYTIMLWFSWVSEVIFGENIKQVAPWRNNKSISSGW